MKKLITALALSAIALTVAAGSAHAAGGTYDPTTGVVTVNNTGGLGASYENESSTVPAANGDTLSFEYRTTDVTCAGGTPRVFIQAGEYNTFDADPAGPGACGTDADGDGWFTVTGTISGITDGVAGHIGLVNDNPADPGTIEFRNVTIDGVSLLPAMAPAAPQNKEQCRNGGWQHGGYRNQGACVSAFARS
jgi:hypothetical protein